MATSWTQRTKPTTDWDYGKEDPAKKWYEFDDSTWANLGSDTWNDYAPTSYTQRSSVSSSWTSRTKP